MLENGGYRQALTTSVVEADPMDLPRAASIPTNVAVQAQSLNGAEIGKQPKRKASEDREKSRVEMGPWDSYF